MILSGKCQDYRLYTNALLAFCFGRLQCAGSVVMHETKANKDAKRRYFIVSIKVEVDWINDNQLIFNGKFPSKRVQ
jgi:hypothetical protein